MESHLNFNYRFKIEEKPGGGFIARQEGGDLTLEGATKEEVEQKMLEKLSLVAGPQVAKALKGLSLADIKEQGGIHVERKFNLVINKDKLGAASFTSSLPSSPGTDSTGPISRDAEPLISRQVLWIIIGALALLTLWLLLQRR